MDTLLINYQLQPPKVILTYDDTINEALEHSNQLTNYRFYYPDTDSQISDDLINHMLEHDIDPHFTCAY